MPTSRIRTKKGRTPKKSKADLDRIDNAYQKKSEEYDLMELDELVKLKGTVKGTYAVALNTVIGRKKLPKKKTA